MYEAKLRFFLFQGSLFVDSIGVQPVVDEVSAVPAATLRRVPDRASPVQDPAAYDVARIRLPLPECALRLMNAAEQDYGTLVAQLKGTTWRANPPPEEDADFNQIWKVPRPC